MLINTSKDPTSHSEIPKEELKDLDIYSSLFPVDPGPIVSTSWIYFLT